VQQSPANPNGLPIEQYTYDPVHNRKSSAHQPGAWTYNENNELQAYGNGPDEQTYAYDANGNTIEQKSGDPQNPGRDRVFIYNAAERLSEIRDGGVTIAKYEYDPLGRRIRKEANGIETWFQYADEGLVSEYEDDGTPRRESGWILGSSWGSGPLWIADVFATGLTVNFYHNDHLDTPQRLSSSTGDTTWKMISGSFGETHVVIETTKNQQRFPGQYQDVEVDTNYNSMRDYSFETGRYLQTDPLGFGGGINAFV